MPALSASIPCHTPSPRAAEVINGACASSAPISDTYLIGNGDGSNLLERRAITARAAFDPSYVAEVSPNPNHHSGSKSFLSTITFCKDCENFKSNVSHFLAPLWLIMETDATKRCPSRRFNSAQKEENTLDSSPPLTSHWLAGAEKIVLVMFYLAYHWFLTCAVFVRGGGDVSSGQRLRNIEVLARLRDLGISNRRNK
ncbi:hypothetical protein RRG08_021280 [Elysia crispata]|uniref:Uncharacterized protein n=1 Tax=Elysia crispata TaxID=231223 RepID=A0AAE1DCM3_9GAST|nr:hypothetical protein RRG08_021280 [Elysia crispata]